MARSDIYFIVICASVYAMPQGLFGLFVYFCFFFSVKVFNLKAPRFTHNIQDIELSGTSTAIGKKMDVSEDHHINQNKPNTARKLLLFSLLWEFRKGKRTRSKRQSLWGLKRNGEGWVRKSRQFI